MLLCASVLYARETKRLHDRLLNIVSTQLELSEALLAENARLHTRLAAMKAAAAARAVSDGILSGMLARVTAYAVTLDPNRLRKLGASDTDIAFVTARTQACSNLPALLYPYAVTRQETAAA